jgi:hypothetical protein
MRAADSSPEMRPTAAAEAMNVPVTSAVTPPVISAVKSANREERLSVTMAATIARGCERQRVDEFPANGRQ